MLDIQGLWHPCAVSRATGDAVVPNDLSLGADAPAGYAFHANSKVCHVRHDILNKAMLHDLFHEFPADELVPSVRLKTTRCPIFACAGGGSTMFTRCSQPVATHEPRVSLGLAP